jgi:methyl coenzyme M reductase subunit C-like uncharacterized protein (methanogenesis marker protein 7)
MIMPAGIPNIKDKIVFPPMNIEKEAKLKKLLQSVGDFMGATLEMQLETIVTVKIPDNRVDIYVVLNRVMNALKSGSDEKPSKPVKEAEK